MSWIVDQPKPLEKKKKIYIYMKFTPETNNNNQQGYISKLKSKLNAPFLYRHLAILLFIKLIQCLLMFAVFMVLCLLVKQATAKSLNISDLEGNMDVQAHNSAKQMSSRTCNTIECIKSADNLLHSMDTTADPCEDFYQYACGNWYKEHPAPRHYFSNNWYKERSLFVMRNVEAFLEQNNTKTEPKPVHQARDMYKACLDLLDDYEEKGLMTLKNIMKKLGLSSVPPFHKKIKRDTVTHTLALIQRLLNKLIFIGVYVYPNPFNATENIIALETNGYESLKSIHNENQDIEKILKKHLHDGTHRKIQIFRHLEEYIVLTMKYLLKCNNLNVEKYNSSIYEAANEIIKFKTLYYSDPLNFDIIGSGIQDQLITIDKLQEITDNTNSSSRQKHKTKIFWKEYLQKLFWRIKAKPITDQTKVFIPFRTRAVLVPILNLLSETPDKSILLTLWWEVVDSLNQHTTRYLREIYFNYINKVVGRPYVLTRPLECSELVSKRLTYAAGYSLDTKEFRHKTTKQIHTMINNIQQSLFKSIDNSKWLDRKSKAAIKDKAKAVRKSIGFPKWILKKKALEKFYQGIRINDDTHLDNMLNLWKWESTRMLLKLDTMNAIVNARLEYNPTDVNAFCSLGQNSIMLPAGILQFPFYKLGHKALEYGAIGSVIGHELTHPFDVSGMQRDKYGQYNTLLTHSSAVKFLEKGRCLINQYKSYYIDIAHSYVSGSNTLSENIADNGGTLIAFMSYKNEMKKHGEEKSLPGLTNYTNDQLFFLSFANKWCGKWTERSMIVSLGDTHSPDHIRVLGTLSNLPQFSRAWSCPKGAKMNSKEKCKLW